MDIGWHQYSVAILHDDIHLVRIGVTASLVNTNKCDLGGEICADQELEDTLTIWAKITVIKYGLFRWWHLANKYVTRTDNIFIIETLLGRRRSRLHNMTITYRECIEHIKKKRKKEIKILKF